MKSKIGRALALSLCALAAPAGAGDRNSEIINMVRQDCGSCHGLTMKGGLGPPLLPAVLADKDDAQMLAVILDGRKGTPMPPWRPFLSETEARWVLQVLKKGLPDGR